jgi:TRAP-type C4-dicarboxylate transport system permease small subunit
MVLYVAFFGAALAVERHKHIRIDVVAACLQPDRMRKLRAPLYIISAILCAAMTWAAMRFWYDDWQYVAKHDRWSSILALITPFGFFLLTLHFLLCGLFNRPSNPGNDA